MGQRLPEHPEVITALRCQLSKLVTDVNALMTDAEPEQIRPRKGREFEPILPRIGLAIGSCQNPVRLAVNHRLDGLVGNHRNIRAQRTSEQNAATQRQTTPAAIAFKFPP